MIRTQKLAGRNYYCAKDVVESLGLKWRNFSSLDGIVSPEHIHQGFFPGNDSRIRSAYMLTTTGKKQLEKAHARIQKRNAADAIRRNYAKIRKQNDAMKSAAADIFLKLDPRISRLKKEVGYAKVVKQSKVDPLQKEAWEQTRQLCEKYAENRAKAAGLKKDDEDMRVYHNLTYTALYNNFKQTNGVDLKDLASRMTSSSGRKVSVLEAAASNGYAITLLGLAETLFNN